MAALSPASKRAIANLRAFKPPPTNYYKCPLTRRAAVLILLFADRAGDLRVVLTIRSSNLKNYSGQAALPGGKADTLHETPFQTARREAFEEIGLPLEKEHLPTGYDIEHLTELPANLAMTELGVRPCVAYLQTPEPFAGNRSPNAARDLLPKLDAKEVAAVFTAPFFNFLRERDVDPAIRDQVPGEWYKGSWHSWHETAWRMHQFHVPVTPSTVFLAGNNAKPAAAAGTPRQDERKSTSDQPTPASSTSTTQTQPSTPTPTSEATGPPGSRPDRPASSSLQPPLPRTFYTTPSSSSSPSSSLQSSRYRVFGMTARILVDCARVAYAAEPSFEHNSHFGDEEMIERLLGIGRLAPKKREGEVLTREVMERARRGTKI
ncbi:hypothetical protein KC363_g915 [Hortaea werneckii]|nr:hypothetical protein KC325_g1352 [Hortaea werneckii]KAI6997333.1 hypothetical protein KC359_g3021 [Hortaea werneckii]KAI7091183.1 hypothetical protein KC356_g970 [Hortaea werneckii]KAI7148228.1 hypothetical protein KC344_g2171 [Hortaea werneckii]KAI7178043.1 hypothetical protein KC360_g1872 [Hortaea werneckii]